MKLSVKSHYAARAVLCLARTHQNQATQRTEDLAREENIPANYLVQILIELKAAGIVTSVRGKDGGYRLAKSPADITLGEIIRCFHGNLFDTPATDDASNPAELRDAWHQLQKSLDQAADAIDFQQLVEEGLRRGGMYYI